MTLAINGVAEYVQGADLADLAVTWLDSSGQLIDFSADYGFVLRVGRAGKPAKFEKTSGFTGAATAPNLTVQWATTGELNTLVPGRWDLQILATRTSDSRTRILSGQLVLEPAITAPA